ncbi:FAD-dependent monooxygenase [Cyanobacterium stanieri LEGE 03274]|uniref:FAD-dependent monooxygenase n=1 Tax=Cyanobacterium stanieri LEGE 03274 TaxID=1828756 RepID=A0ABR9V187_9CHRO|nr:FAD-dependent monooxygenase [Cyanobacterium stanieri]MBE9221642.1 FAD-dependent monooxygenase [Cyanobacterium stanieri LEGE 03274]
MSEKIAIIGAGIGGLTLALALEKKGIDFHLYEQANSFEALGYGLQLSPNVVRILQDLGMGKELEAISHRCLGFELRSFETDRTLAQWKLDSDTPYYQCRRADLHQLLYNSLQNKNKISFAQKLQSYQVKDEQITLNFQNQDSVKVFALVGADGVRSHVRKTLFPQEKPQYAGYAAYRAILPFKTEYHSLMDKATVWMGENHHVVAYPNGNQNPWLNLVLVVKNAQWQEQGWTIPADKQEIAKSFQNKSKLLNTILTDLVSNPEPCYKWGLFDHQPLPFWTQGKITLLGDSAHPLLPFQAQGAAMAMEDAYILARCIDQKNTIEEAFIKYQDLRLKRTAKVQQTSRNNADIFHATGIKAMVRDMGLGLISMVNGQLLNQKTAWIYNYNALDLS